MGGPVYPLRLFVCVLVVAMGPWELGKLGLGKDGYSGWGFRGFFFTKVFVSM